MKTRTRPKRFRTGIIGRARYVKIVRILERMRERNVNEWAAAVVRDASKKQQRALLFALEDGHGPVVGLLLDVVGRMEVQRARLRQAINERALATQTVS